MQTIEEALDRLQTSRFRASFHLEVRDIAYIDAKGLETVQEHCRDFIAQRLAPARPLNDGNQTPMHGHPVFRAQHACACCCRGCLEKWYRVAQGVELTPVRQEKIVHLLMAWIEREYRQAKNKGK